ncbi:hypothetical protein RUM43_014871 [Polyplax serrata]|uniref:Uncharacterized protein n=1 Tax=Polyplax serrata TaxID=468196 RepID=A0AAN8NP96_POLSC
MDVLVLAQIRTDMKSVGIGDTVMGKKGNVTCAEKQHAGPNRPTSHSPIHISKDEVKLTNLTQAASRKRIKSVIKNDDYYDNDEDDNESEAIRSTTAIQLGKIGKNLVSLPLEIGEERLIETNSN